MPYSYYNYPNPTPYIAGPFIVRLASIAIPWLVENWYVAVVAPKDSILMLTCELASSHFPLNTTVTNIVGNGKVDCTPWMFKSGLTIFNFIFVLLLVV